MSYHAIKADVNESIVKRALSSSPEKENAKRVRGEVQKQTKKKLRTVLNKIVQRASTEGQLFVCGTNDFGQLGLEGDEKNRPVPIKSMSEKKFVDVISGGLHSFALTTEGELFSWGCTDEGVLGREGKNDEPMLLAIEPRFVKLVAGDCINMALTSEGDVYSWGTYRGADGAFGFSPTLSQQSTPLLFDALGKETIVDIATGTNHSLALSADGRVFTWGYGEQGQLGRRLSPRYPKDSLRPLPLALKNIKSIGAGAYHSLAVTHDNQLYAWGLNNFRQCVDSSQSMLLTPTLVPLPESIGNIVAVDGGEHFTVIMNDQGELYCFGRGDAHQLGLPKEIMEPLKLTSSESAFKFIIPQPTKIPALPPVVHLSVGSEFVLVACDNGQGYSWGFNSSNAIGNGSDEDEPLPSLLKGKNLGTNKIVRVAAGGQHSVFLTHA
ncbi:regulator of chromosome condensation 1/beta-lactamase-inhibitor protein II [Sporodiniella umbellata]|nr:regulator of chromosome condensation 1/beta-lactamase-inhibitor protein II [Sporodiniella umbellata]